MYNIKQAAARAGVSVPVMRAWERRYGIVAPARTPSGYRQFDDAAVARVRAMRELVDAGWSPSAASAAILSGAEPNAPSRAQAPDLLERSAGDTLGERLVEAAAALDDGAVEGVLDDAFARGSFERAVMDQLFPALRTLGDAWAAGRVSVAGEHLASAAVLRRLGLALDAAARYPRGTTIDRVIVGLPPGGRHELGALAFAIAASRGGLAVSYLGPDLPAVDWLAAARRAAAAVVGIVTPGDRRAGLEVARRLREADPRLVVALGGPAVPRVPRGLSAIVLPASLPAAVDALRAAIGERAA